jgi:hypothetical protein
MGQFALGLRSWLVKITVFVIMAALLAWALGGTLFPRPSVAKFEPVSFAGERWYWKLSVGGKNAGEVRWDLMTQGEDDKTAPFDANRHWAEVAGPIVSGDTLYFAGRETLHPAQPWRIEAVDSSRKATAHPMPDRLAVEQQLARLAAGLTLQDQQTIRRMRQAVLDPAPELADNSP